MRACVRAGGRAGGWTNKLIFDNRCNNDKTDIGDKSLTSYTFYSAS